MTAIAVTNLGKAYKTYARRIDRLSEWMGGRERHTLHWVLKDVSFSVAAGESVGIIGVNGAGKSTLLKMITGTVKATEGVVQVNGRVAALLELGLGFHPDFTGRQNVLMSGQLMGYSILEIERLMSSIEEFAGIGEYIDRPVRIYSSGMQVRLAFAVATASRPDILIVDEALAVGDMQFQQKCYSLIRRYLAEGTTLIFVSHGMNTILDICKRTLYIRSGQLVFDGLSKEAVDIYQADLLMEVDEGSSKPTQAQSRISAGSDGHDNRTIAIGLNDQQAVAGSLYTDRAHLVAATLFNMQGHEIQALITGQSVRLRVSYRCLDLLS
ncbi:MAG: ABC transporter ATP-binding protein, partial [Beijerinckiaceae bacterium]